MGFLTFNSKYCVCLEDQENMIEDVEVEGRKRKNCKKFMLCEWIYM